MFVGNFPQGLPDLSRDVRGLRQIQRVGVGVDRGGFQPRDPSTEPGFASVGGKNTAGDPIDPGRERSAYLLSGL